MEMNQNNKAFPTPANEEKVAFTNNGSKATTTTTTTKESLIRRGHRRRKRTTLEKCLFVTCVLLFILCIVFIVIASVNQRTKGKMHYTTCTYIGSYVRLMFVPGLQETNRRNLTGKFDVSKR